jgi:hypothetical protein
MDASPPGAGGGADSLLPVATTSESISPALACAAQLDALMSQLDVSPGSSGAPRPRPSAVVGETTQLHDAVLAVALAAPIALAPRADARSMVLTSSCARSALSAEPASTSAERRFIPERTVERYRMFVSRCLRDRRLRFFCCLMFATRIFSRFL